MEIVELTEENQNKIIKALYRLRLTGLEKNIMQMGISGFYDLTFASYYGNRIKALCKVPKASGIIEDILFKLLSELSDFINSRENTPVEVRMFARRIMAQFGQLSISSVAHWIYLIQGSTPPFDQEFYGFDKRRLLGSLYKYLEAQKAWVDDKERQTAETMSLAERNIALAKVLDENKEVQAKFRELRQKLESKHKDLSIYQQRTYNRK